MPRSAANTTPGKPLRLFVSVGEASADLHAANLIREIRKLRGDVVVEGMGGPLMAQAGCHIRYPITKMGFMGFRKVYANFHRLWRMQRDTLRHFETYRPDAVVLVDFPGYNLWLARKLRKRRIPVVHYISPQIWAWMPGRIHKIRRRVTKVLCILPFEEEIYRRAGVPVEYVGHPLFDHLNNVKLDEAFCRELRAAAGETLIGLLPGSRTQEVKRMLPVMARAAQAIHREMPQAFFAVPCAGEAHEKLAQDILKRYDVPVRTFARRTFEVMKEADFCIVTSGTATLELAHFNTPMLVAYRINFLSHLASRIFLHTRFIAMVNVLSGREVVPERLLWHDAPDELARTVLDVLRNPDRHAEVMTALEALRQKCDHPGASRQAAEAVLRTAEELRGRVPAGGSQWPNR